MKINGFLKIGFVLIVVLITFAFSSCEKQVTGVKIDTAFDEGTTLPLGFSIQLKAILLPENARKTDLIWTSSNLSVATITQSGYLKTVGVGNATITCTTKSGNYSDSMDIDVVENYAYALYGKYDGTIVIDDKDTIKDVTLDMITTTLASNSILIAVDYDQNSIECNAVITLENNLYRVKGNGVYNNSTSLEVEGTVDESGYANFSFILLSDTPKKITFIGIKRK